MLPKIDKAKLLAYHRAVLKAGCAYKMGAKPAIGDKPGEFSYSDCSGYVRIDLHAATSPGIVLPLGSWGQRLWCEDRVSTGEVKRTSSYENAARYMTDSRLFLCFIVARRNGAGSDGHAWFLTQIDGVPKTIECHGGKGVDSRAWDTPVLKSQVYAVYELETL